MLKKLLVAAFIALPLCASAQDLKFATVNLQTIFQAMPETTAANAAIQEKAKQYEDENLKMREELEKKYTEYTAERETLPENIRARREQEIQEISQRMENFMEVARNDLQQQQEQLIAPIQEKLMNAVKEVATEGNYVYVLDEQQVVFKGSMTEDITPKVIAKLGIQ